MMINNSKQQDTKINDIACTSSGNSDRPVVPLNARRILLFRLAIFQFPPANIDPIFILIYMRLHS